MKIGLISVDGKNFPNLALMKISAYHKMIGDTVEWYSAMERDSYDMAYASKIFSFTPDYPYPLPENTLKGGTGYGLYHDLPDEIDNMFPDYSIYPYDYAIGFLTRGCIRKCPWCVVPKKEGYIRPYRKWEDIKRNDSCLGGGSKNMVLMDNNVLACDWGIEQIERMGGENVRVDFNQGLDARLITAEIAKKLALLKWYKPLRMACDTPEMIPIVEEAVSRLREAKCKPQEYFVYVLVNDVEEAHARVEKLRKMKVSPFAQPYIDFDNNIMPTDIQRHFARWVNMKACFKSCSWDEYRKLKKQENHNENIF